VGALDRPADLVGGVQRGVDGRPVGRAVPRAERVEHVLERVREVARVLEPDHPEVPLEGVRPAEGLVERLAVGRLLEVDQFDGELADGVVGLADELPVDAHGSSPPRRPVEMVESSLIVGLQERQGLDVDRDATASSPITSVTAATRSSSLNGFVT
jgi:hypothetical protein